MATDSGSQARHVLPTPSTRDVAPLFGIGSFVLGSHIGIAFGLIQATHHASMQSPNRPSFLRTTGRVAGATAGGFCFLALGSEITGMVDLAAEFRKPFQTRDGTQRTIYPDLKQMRSAAAMYFVSAISGAGVVEYRSGLRRGNVSRMIGGGCLGAVTFHVVISLLGSAAGKTSREM